MKKHFHLNDDEGWLRNKYVKINTRDVEDIKKHVINNWGNIHIETTYMSTALSRDSSGLKEEWASNYSILLKIEVATGIIAAFLREVINSRYGKVGAELHNEVLIAIN